MLLLNRISKQRPSQLDSYLGELQFELDIIKRIREWVMTRIDLHNFFEQIPQAKKEQVRLGISTAVSLVQTFNTHLYDPFVQIQYAFVNEILSIPTCMILARYFLPLKPELNFKTLYSAYYFC